MTSHRRRGVGHLAALLVAVAAVVAVMVVGPALPASAHPISTSAVLLDLGADQVTTTLELPLTELGLARNDDLTAATVVEEDHLPELRDYVQAHLTASDTTGQSWTTQVSGGQVESIDGAANLVLHAVLTPSAGVVGDFVLHDDVVMDRLVSHRVFVSARYGSSGPYTTLAMLSWQTQTVSVTGTPPPESRGFFDAVQLGVHHIATGSDHLLFLLMLLLPAPLLASRRRWAQRLPAGAACWWVVHVVTAFAVGHSLTLAFGALGWLSLPSRVIESGIALSVLVSAVHAIRPLVPRGETLIAGGFGLLHGLAFATLLTDLDLSRFGLVATLLGFNVGIEIAQLLVVALVMPSLVLLSRSATYPIVRVTAASVGAVLAVGWLLDRNGLTDANPVEPVSDLLVNHPLRLASGLAVLALITSWRHRRRAVRGAATRVTATSSEPATATPVQTIQGTVS